MSSWAFDAPRLRLGAMLRCQPGRSRLGHTGVMSDLQCAATFLVVGVQSGDQVSTLADRLRHARVALTYGGPDPAAVRTAEQLAASLGTASKVTDLELTEGRLRDHDAGILAALRDLADVHRGETVLLVAEHGPETGWLEVLVDGDGFSTRRVR